MNYHSITYPDFNNGVGCRVTLWVSGCPHQCPGCHNSHTWDPNSGTEFTNNSKQLLFDVLKLPYIQGITVSGGEPLTPYNIPKISKLLEEIKILFPEKDIWVYTGYTIEELLNQDEPIDEYLYKQSVFENIDFLVEGRYMRQLRDTSLAFRGSSNQRIFKVLHSSKNKFQFVLYEE